MGAYKTTSGKAYMISSDTLSGITQEEAKRRYPDATPEALSDILKQCKKDNVTKGGK